MAAASQSSTFSLTTANPRPKIPVDEFRIPCEEDDQDILSKVFKPQTPGSITLQNLDEHLNSELNKAAQTTPTQTRDGILGPDEIKLANQHGLLYEIDRLGVTGQGNFPTVRSNACVYSGKYMYEVLLGSKGLMQVGWCSLQCKFNNTIGVGDTPLSFAYDGNRIRKWNVRTEKYGEAWLTGDVIGCCIDCDEGLITFYRNGNSLGIAFESIPLGKGQAYFPAVSLSYGESVRVNFGSTAFIYPVKGFPALEVSPLIQLNQTNTLLEYLQVILDNLNRESIHTISVILLTHIFEHLAQRIKIPYVMQAAFIPFLKSIVENNSSEIREFMLKILIKTMWGILEDHEIKIAVEHLIHGLLTLYRFTNTGDYYTSQKSYLFILLKLMQHEASRKYSVKWVLFDKIKFPLYIYIKPPDDSTLKHLVPTVWWPSEHISDPVKYSTDKAEYYKSCDQLTSNVKAIEDLQTEILKELLNNDDSGVKGQSTREIFLCKFRDFLKDNINSSGYAQMQQCALPVLLAVFHRVVRVLKEILQQKHTDIQKVHMPVEKFIEEGGIDYFDLSRVGGLKSHLIKEHNTIITERQINVSKKKTTPAISAEQYHSGLSDEESSLIELLDGAVILYSYGAHKQLQKMSSVLTEAVDCYVNALDDTISKLERCPPEESDIRSELERSKTVFENRVREQSRHLSWLIAIINSRDKFHDVIWIFQYILNTIEYAYDRGELSTFMPEVYVNGCIDAYMSLKSFFKLANQPFSQHPEYNDLLRRYAIFLSKHFANPRIFNMDLKDTVVQSLACFVCYESSLKVLENLPRDLLRSVVRSLLAAYEDRPWAQTNWILARLWKGDGFAFRFIHLPHLSPVKYQQQEIGAASLQKPCPSRVFQREIAQILSDENKMATQFMNSVLNSLNWAFSEFIGMIQEVARRSTRNEKIHMEMRQLKICATCFDLSVGLLRVMEMIANVVPDLFLSENTASAELLLSRLYQSLSLILSRIENNTSFENVLTLNLPGMETVDHFPIITAIVGIIVSLTMRSKTEPSRHKAVTNLLKEPGFKINLLEDLLNRDLSSPGATSVNITDKRFVLNNCKEINQSELNEILNLVKVLNEVKTESDRSQRSSASVEEEKLCTICYDREKTILFVPCGHSSCRQCVTQQTLMTNRCFFCLTNIDSVTALDGVKLELLSD